MTFVDSSYRDRIRLDSVTCVVDADQVLRDDDPDVVKLKLQQIGFADLVILNKVDLAGVDGATTVKRWIDHHFTRVRLVPAINCEVPLDLLLSVGRFDESQVTHDAHRDNEEHGARFGTQSYTDDRPLSRRSLERMIKRELPAAIYRCKGFVSPRRRPGQPLRPPGRRSTSRPRRGPTVGHRTAPEPHRRDRAQLSQPRRSVRRSVRYVYRRLTRGCDASPFNSSRRITALRRHAYPAKGVSTSVQRWGDERSGRPSACSIPTGTTIQGRKWGAGPHLEGQLYRSGYPAPALCTAAGEAVAVLVLEARPAGAAFVASDLDATRRVR